MVITADSLEELEKVASAILDYGQDFDVWIFKGNLGAGKTTLIKSICEHLDVIDSVSSPTFALINEYQTDRGDTVFHFDFYRINTEKEAEDLGLLEYFYSGDLCLIEWPEKIPNLIPEQYLEISIKFMGTKREFHITKHGPEIIRD